MLSLSRGQMSLFNTLSEITDYLFLSGSNALKKDKIQQRQITCIVNATTEEPNAYIDGIDYIKVRVEDHPFSRLDSYFDMVADRIQQNRKNGERTLVHCVAGVSRSASLIMVYLVKYNNMTLREAYQHVKAIRPIVRPNSGFWKQMIEFERRVKHGRSTVKMVAVGRGDADEDKLPDVYVDEIRHRQQMQREGLSGSLSSSRASSVGPPSLTNGRRGVFSANGHSHSTGGLTNNSNGSKMSTSLTSTVSPSILSSSRLNRHSTAGSRYSNAYNSVHAMYSPRAHYTASIGRAANSTGSRPGSASQYSFMLNSATPTKHRGGSRSGKHADNNLFSNLYNSTADLFYPGL